MTTTLTAYTPAAHGGTWATQAATEAGFDAARLQAAVEFAIASDSPWPRSFYYPDGRYVGIVEWNETGPWSEITGPVRAARGPGRSDPQERPHRRRVGRHARTDMTFSVAKSYLAVCAGLAVADGLDRIRRRAGGADRQRTVVRRCAQRAHHVAASAAAIERVAGRDLGQVRSGRPQPPARRRRQQPQGAQPQAAAARNALRIQRRAREPAGVLPAAALRPRRCPKCCASA